MSANDNTGNKMKKALKRIFDGPVESRADDENPKEELLKKDTPESTSSTPNESKVSAVPPTDAGTFNTMIKENLSKFESSGSSAKRSGNSFSQYNESRKGEITMKNTIANDKVADIFTDASGSENSEVTIISKDTSIVGEIHSDTNIEIFGSMKGNIIAKGSVSVRGKVSGDIKGADIDLSTCTVQGNIIASGTLSVDCNSVLIGDVKAENLSINGKLKGNAQVLNMIACQSEALILGNVTAAVASINEGAKLQGTVQIADEHIAEIKITEDEATNWSTEDPDSIPAVVD